jgi:hypothetical protein
VANKCAVLAHMATVGTLSPTLMRYEREYAEFCGLNDVSPESAAAAELYVFSLMNSRLKKTSVAERVSKVLNARRGAARARMTQLLQAVQLEAADCELAHALDLLPSTALALAQRVRSREHQAILWAMCCVGVRCSDLRRLRKKQIMISRDRVEVEVRVAKNRRSLHKRRILRLSRRWAPWISPVLEKLSAFLDQCNPDDRPFRARATEVNRSLSLAAEQLGRLLEQCHDAGRLPTTYSFRRLYVAEMLRVHNYDFEKTAEKTLHFSDETLRAHYDRAHYRPRL